MDMAYSKMADTSGNIVFTLRSLTAPWSARGNFEEADPGGQPCEPNRVAAAPSGLKVLGFVNTKDVIRNLSDLIKEGIRQRCRSKNLFFVVSLMYQETMHFEEVTAGIDFENQ